MMKLAPDVRAHPMRLDSTPVMQQQQQQQMQSPQHQKPGGTLSEAAVAAAGIS